MEELVEYIAKSLADDPSQVQVRRKVTNSAIILELEVAPEDTGRIIGKQGAVANAIRSLLQSFPHDRKKRVILKIL